MVILHKQKEDILSCKNFRSMKILDHVFNIMERVTEGRLRDHKYQFGFIPYYILLHYGCNIYYKVNPTAKS